ncbi:MAG: hypothetical protein KGH54_02975 [Candidatus Micrarchaeota archaeon]|nr:hypothetical protein [Candidatus Micrarchaeota archaeon]
MEYAKVTLDKSALPRVIEKTLAIVNEGKAPSEKVDGVGIKSLLRIVDGQIKFVSKATTPHEKAQESKLHQAVITAEQQIFKEELIGLARDAATMFEKNAQIMKTYENYAKVFSY